MAETPRRRRKLAAILMMDVVGFSRMMGRDEEATTSAILAFHETVKSVIEDHGGRVVSTAGDSVFGDFDSIVEALESAERIQRALAAENAGRREDERIQARIGLHLGDVIVEERNVFGDGVNVAARLEQMAEPGGIMLSEAAYHLIRGRTDLPIEMVGMQELKNIAEPIEVYRIGPDAFGTDGAARPTPDGDGDDSVDSSETAERIREAVARIAERVADRVEDGDGGEGVDRRDIKREIRRAIIEDDSMGTVFQTSSLVLMSLGVAGILARTSGWSDNAWYPFLGAYLLGIGFGGLMQRIARRDGLAGLFSAVGMTVGAFFFENGVTQAFFWIVAVAIFGGSLGKLASGSRRRRRR
jgi:class 3 adenylate cyclase